jgi:hypothetical protein
MDRVYWGEEVRHIRKRCLSGNQTWRYALAGLETYACVMPQRKSAWALR